MFIKKNKNPDMRPSERYFQKKKKKINWLHTTLFKKKN